MSVLAKKIVDLGELVLMFARVDRATYHEDGKRKESDTDHTVMLGILGCSVASRLYPEMDLGKIAQYSLVHDVVEVYAGDTPTFNASTEVHAEKVKREEDAFKRLQVNFPEFPWVTETIARYEKLEDKESRFVKAFDKCMPKITHILNKGASFKEVGKNREEMVSFFIVQHQKLSETYAKDFPELMDLVREIMDRTIAECFE
jgi:5'-deoxynucleotidase YfbR-like HD superfamily hydrolase